jgi:hypothetical protein
MIIDCDNCLVRDIACGDCVVSVLIGSPTPASIEPGSNGNQLNAEEARVIDLLSSRGMVPPLRFTDSEDSQAQKSRSG